MKETAVSRTRLNQARVLCAMGARAVIVTSATGVRQAEARDLYKQMNQNQPSPSGQTPHSLEWYTERTARQFQASILLKLHYTFTAQGLPPDQAFLAAVTIYFELYGGDSDKIRVKPQRFISVERAHYLLRRARDSKFLNTPDVNETLKVMTCRSCGSDVLAAAHEATFICPLCSGSVT